MTKIIIRSAIALLIGGISENELFIVLLGNPLKDPTLKTTGSKYHKTS